MPRTGRSLHAGAPVFRFDPLVYHYLTFATCALVLAGGKGTRLYPLTKERAKPAVPFGGRYRIVDFVLSNLVNSGIYSIYVLIQFKSQSLLQHLREGWEIGGLLRNHL